LTNLLDQLRATACRFDAAVGAGLVAHYHVAAQYLEELLSDDEKACLAAMPARPCRYVLLPRFVRRELAGMLKLPSPRREPSVPVPWTATRRAKRHTARSARSGSRRAGDPPDPEAESERRPGRRAALDRDVKSSNQDGISKLKLTRKPADRTSWSPESCQDSAIRRQPLEITLRTSTDPRLYRQLEQDSADIAARLEGWAEIHFAGTSAELQSWVAGCRAMLARRRRLLEAFDKLSDELDETYAEQSQRDNIIDLLLELAEKDAA
jgi:hypothetical protein